MLVLSRKLGEELVIDGPCRIRVVDVRGDRVRLGFTADESVRIDRAEVDKQKQKRKEREHRDAA